MVNPLNNRVEIHETCKPTYQLPTFPMESNDDIDRDRSWICQDLSSNVRSCSLIRTLRHTGPSIHLRLFTNHHNPDSPAGLTPHFLSSSHLSNSGSDQDGEDSGEASPHLVLPQYTERPATRDKTSGTPDPGSVRQQTPEHLIDDFISASEYLPFTDGAITPDGSLTLSPPSSPDHFSRGYNPDRDNIPVASGEPPSESTSRSTLDTMSPIPITASMRWNAVRDWILSDSVSLTFPCLRPFNIFSLPDRFVNCPDFARYYAVVNSTGEWSNEATCDGSSTEHRTRMVALPDSRCYFRMDGY
jgi:hypothetical protein